MATWRLARSLGRLRTQINDAFPGRSKLADGTLGDARHRARGSQSDHNPWVRLGRLGIVTALDITHDPRRGVDTHALAERLRVTRDRRIKYVISRRQIFSSSNRPWVWRAYSQTPHTGHVHISCSASPQVFDLIHPWDIGFARIDITLLGDSRADTLRLGSTGEDVRILQRLLDMPADGIFGLMTDSAVRKFQTEAGIVVDGVVGPQTWQRLELLEAEAE